MSNVNLFSIARSDLTSAPRQLNGPILLVKPPYFTPWTPPLGISIMKSFLSNHGYSCKCFDFNTDPELWGMHHKYFAALQSLEEVSTNDGYSKLWWILNAHMLSYANRATPEECASVLEVIIPMYGIRCNSQVIKSLIHLVDRFYRKLGEITDSLDLQEYSVVGTSTYTTSLGPSLFFLRRIKEKYPHILTVMGGGIFADDLALDSENLNTLIDEYPYVNHVILGEGELLFLKLIEGELANKRVISIGDLKGTTLDMKDVPSPDFSDFSPANYYHLTIEGARSCPFQCSFCSETIQWGDYRKKPMDLFTQQVIDLAEKFNNNSFFMGDSLMNPYIFQFSSALIEKKANVLYDGYLRADKPVTYREKVKTWAQSGFYRARLGIESASKRVLDGMDKMTSPETISEALKSLANAGIRTTTYWIVGFPGETEEDFQETLDFIREHHKYIYELEAHPYYYYPYGQIGSRLYQCYSLYPEVVTKHTRFKVWEVVDSNPSREKRYERLRRISLLAAELGLPNIYTMAERYQAEDRWHLLYPLATEIYDSPQAKRSEAQLPGHPVPAFSAMSKSNPISCLRTKIKKRLNETILSASIECLIKYNDILMMSFQDGQYIPQSAGDEDQQTLSIYTCVKETDLDALIRQIIGERSESMRPRRGRGFHVALINTGEQSCELLLLAHSAIADSKSVGLLFEDLFRIYEQLSSKREIALRPVAKMYSQFLDELTAARGGKTETTQRARHSGAGEPQRFTAESLPQALATAQEAGSTTLLCNKELTTRMFCKDLHEFDLRPADVFVAALLRSLAKGAGRSDIAIDVTHDYRFWDKSLANTAGALMQTFRLPACAMVCDASVTGLQQLQKIVRQTALDNWIADSHISPENALAEKQGLLNLEYCVDQPWLGGDLWTPQGYVITETGPRDHYLFEITPILSNDLIEIRLACRGGPEVRNLLDELSTSLLQEVESVLDSCENYIAAREFWMKEFGKGMPQRGLELESDDFETAASGLATIPFRVATSTLDKLQAECNTDLATLLLSAYCVCLARMSGQEDLVIVSSIAGDKGGSGIPLRLYPSWSLNFGQFIHNTEQKLRLAFMYGAHSFEFLTSGINSPQETGSHPVFNTGFIFADQDQNEHEHATAEILKGSPELDRQIILALEVVRGSCGVEMQFVYDKRRFHEETINTLGTCLASIIKEGASNIYTRIEDIALGSTRESEALDFLTQDAFDFGQVL